MNSCEILEKLIAFPTVSSDSNLDLITFCQDLLERYGFDCQRIPDSSGNKASLVASYQSHLSGGLVLSAHSDVVPVSGQDWTYPPFQLTRKGNRLFGRGSTDMKGFLACMLYFASLIKGKKTKEPLYLCISYDEEIGCVGVRPMLEEMIRRKIFPRACLVGEPTLMRVAVGHKGKIASDIIAKGTSGHSALAPQFLNAIYLLTDFIQLLRNEQDALAKNGRRDMAYDIPYTTLHTGIIKAGTALNIVPDIAKARFEIRNIYADKAEDLLQQLRIKAGRIVEKYRSNFPQAALEIEVYNDYPALETSPSVPFVQEIAYLAHNQEDAIKVAYGTEAGLFAEKLGCPVVVCGPGSMAQGHQRDEFIDIAQLELCDAMMRRLAEQCIA